MCVGFSFLILLSSLFVLASRSLPSAGSPSSSFMERLPSDLRSKVLASVDRPSLKSYRSASSQCRLHTHHDDTILELYKTWIQNGSMSRIAIAKALSLSWSSRSRYPCIDDGHILKRFRMLLANASMIEKEYICMNSPTVGMAELLGCSERSKYFRWIRGNEIMSAGQVQHFLIEYIRDRLLLIQKVWNDDVEEVRRFLTSSLIDADVNLRPINLLLYAINQSSHDMVKLLLDYGANPLTTTNTGTTTLMVAVQVWSLEKVQLLLNHHVEVNAQDEAGRTALMFAAIDGRHEIANVLLEHGADASLKSIHDMTAFLYACSEGRYEVAKMLITPDNVNEVNVFAVSPLAFAARSGNGILTKFLLENGADLNQIDTFQQAPIHYAAAVSVSITKLLLRKGADPNSFAFLQNTPLFFAADQKKHKIIDVLLKNGADPTIGNHYGNLPLYVSCAKGHIKIVKQFFKANVPIDASNDYGYACVHFAAINNHLDLMHFLFEVGVDMNQVSLKTNETPLILASIYGHEAIVKMLLQRKVNIHVADFMNVTAMERAIERNNVRITSLLLQAGADPNRRGGFGFTPLMMASIAGYFDIGIYLVHAGAEINTRNDFDESAVEMAWRSKHFDMFRWLISRGASMSSAISGDNRELDRVSPSRISRDGRRD